MEISRAEAYAPATVANLGAGFDILGLALSEPGDTVSAEWDDQPQPEALVRVAAITGDGGKLPLDPLRNTAAVAATSTLRLAGVTRPVKLTIHKGLPLASGLGSSAASSVAGAVAVNALLGDPLTHDALLPACLDGEAAVSGYHADNVAPCLYGGITLSYGVTADTIRRLPIPPDLHLALVTPAVEVPTAQARAVLPAAVPLKLMVAQTGAVARLIDALYRSDVVQLALAMESDVVIEPARAYLMPALDQVRAAAKAAGALALVISGAGPTLMAVSDRAEVAARAASAMKRVYDDLGIESTARATGVGTAGARVIGRVQRSA